MFTIKDIEDRLNGLSLLALQPLARTLASSPPAAPGVLLSALGPASASSSPKGLPSTAYFASRTTIKFSIP
jgi:hypothetical protein